MRCLFLISLLAIAAPAHAHLVGVSYTPERPSAGQPLTVTVDTYLPDSCWSLSARSQATAGQELRVFIDLVDESSPDIPCLLYITELRLDFVFEDLAAGDYLIRVTERHISQSQPGEQTLLLPVHVAGAVAGERMTWSAVKGTYR